MQPLVDFGHRLVICLAAQVSCGGHFSVELGIAVHGVRLSAQHHGAHWSQRIVVRIWHIDERDRLARLLPEIIPVGCQFFDNRGGLQPKLVQLRRHCLCSVLRAVVIGPGHLNGDWLREIKICFFQKLLRFVGIIRIGRNAGVIARASRRIECGDQSDINARVDRLDDLSAIDAVVERLAYCLILVGGILMTLKSA